MSRFLVAGFVQIETIVKVDKLPLAYEQFSSIPNTIYTNVGGDGYNEAIALKWLGNDVSFISMVGKNQNIEILKPQDIEIDIQYVLPRLEETPTAVILYEPTGKMQTFEDVKDIREVSYDMEILEEQVQKNDMIMITNANFCRPVVELAQKYHKPLAVNIRSMQKKKMKYKIDFLEAADILYVSDDDLEQDPYECMKESIERYQPEIMILGIGSKGVLLYTKKDNSILQYKPVKTNEIVNTVGAGNALFSAFLHYYTKTGNAKESIKNALLFASYKIGFVGTSRGFMTEEQIEQWKKFIWKN